MECFCPVSRLLEFDCIVPWMTSFFDFIIQYLQILLTCKKYFKKRKEVFMFVFIRSCWLTICRKSCFSLVQQLENGNIDASSSLTHVDVEKDSPKGKVSMNSLAEQY